MRAPFPRGFDMALAFTAIVHGSIRDFTADAELNGLPEGQGAPRIPISARSVGRSMLLPHQTTRRHVEALIADGWVERRGQGLVAAPGVLTGPRLRPAADGLYERLDAILTGLAALDPAPEPFRLAPGRAPLSMVVAGGHVLRWVDRYVGEIGRLNTGALTFWAIMQANTRHFIEDVDLQRLYADRPPPDDLRRPASVRQVAELLGLPYETVRQRVGMMFDAGLLTRVAGGVIATRQVMEDHQASHRADLTDLRRLLAQLSECGVLLPG